MIVSVILLIILVNLLLQIKLITEITDVIIYWIASLVIYWFTSKLFIFLYIFD